MLFAPQIMVWVTNSSCHVLIGEQLIIFLAFFIEFNANF